MEAKKPKTKRRTAKRKKKPARKPRATAKPRFPAGLVDRLVLMLVSNVPPDAIAASADKLDTTPQVLAAAVTEARRQITLAADFHRDREIGLAYKRLNEIFRRSLAIQDGKTALAAQKELNKLLRLYEPGPAGPVEVTTDGGSDAAAAREHLATLGLADEDEPLAELARLAVLRIVELNAERIPPNAQQDCPSNVRRISPGS